MRPPGNKMEESRVPQTAAALLRLDQNPEGWVSAEERAEKMMQPASSSLSLPFLSLAFGTLLAIGRMPRFFSLFLYPFFSYLFDLI